jgi:class 3 adenylate cyclase
MALSGAPMTHEEPCPASALAALGIRRALCEDSEKADAERSALTVRIGIHTAAVVFGPITEKLPMEYTGIGDTANIAARLQQAAEPRMILVSEAVNLLAGEAMRLSNQPGISSSKAGPSRSWLPPARGVPSALSAP